MALNQNYYELWFVSFRLELTGGHKDSVQLHLVHEQNLPSEIWTECKNRKTDPFSLLTECNKDFFYGYPVGTKFRLKAKLTDRERGGLYFYTYHKWKPLEVRLP